MSIGLRGWVLALAVAVGASIAIQASVSSDSARSEIRLQLADLLFGDERYWDSLDAYNRAKIGATDFQLIRASRGLVSSLLQVAEFSRAHEEAEFLSGLDPNDPVSQTLYGDALWAAGLFVESEAAYRDVVAAVPAHGRARHGIARSLAARGRLDDALAEIYAALEADDSAENYHTLSTIYRRLRQYPAAASSLMQYVDRLSRSGRSEKTEWARSEIRFLRSFGDRIPFNIDEDELAQVHTIPFELDRDKVVIRGRINDGDLIDLVIDTGAEQMVLSKPTAQRYGVRPITTTLSAGVGDIGLRGLEMGRADFIEIGSLGMQR